MIERFNRNRRNHHIHKSETSHDRSRCRCHMQRLSPRPSGVRVHEKHLTESQHQERCASNEWKQKINYVHKLPSFTLLWHANPKTISNLRNNIHISICHRQAGATSIFKLISTHLFSHLFLVNRRRNKTHKNMIALT